MADVIYGINGPVVTVRGAKDFSMLEMVYTGEKRLTGEVISITGELTTIQVYESTSGLKPGEPVFGTGDPLCAVLGPGLITNIFDGIERPLKLLEQMSGRFISEGMRAEPLDGEKKWSITVTAREGDSLKGGDVFAVCPETPAITHKSMVTPDVCGTVVWAAADGDYTVSDTIAVIKDQNGREIKLTLAQRWPVRVARPFIKRLPMSRPLITGQRVIDTLFPIAKGGSAAIPGGFGTGKTITQHQLAKYCDADIIVYVGCGERGNEMTQVLEDFGNLCDPRTGRPMTERTILIANTSNMPVAAREASIYTGITIAEYYRDMGYDVALMADSTSRWAEALREISGRLEEMPAEEGFPAYLPSRLSQFYERAGCTENLNGSGGSVTLIGAVSPQGADFSEPITQNTKRFTGCFWTLDKALAYARHYLAINWTTSYTEYADDLKDWYDENVGEDFMMIRKRIIALLAEESKLMEIVKLIGSDVLPDRQKLTLDITACIRNGFLQQNAFHAEDAYVPLTKQRDMMRVIIALYDCAVKTAAKGVPLFKIRQTGLMERVTRMKYDFNNNDEQKFKEFLKEIEEVMSALDIME